MNSNDKLLIRNMKSDIENIKPFKRITIEVAELERLIKIAERQDKKSL